MRDGGLACRAQGLLKVPRHVTLTEWR
jgi:hypothetical protein